MNPSSVQLQSMLLDPAVNLLYVQMKREMDNSRTQLEQSQKDLAAWKFTPDRRVVICIFVFIPYACTNHEAFQGAVLYQLCVSTCQCINWVNKQLWFEMCLEAYTCNFRRLGKWMDSWRQLTLTQFWSISFVNSNADNLSSPKKCWLICCCVSIISYLWEANIVLL